MAKRRFPPAMRAMRPGSGTIAGVFPPTPRDSDAWDSDVSREIARSAPARGGFYAGDRPEEQRPEPGEDEEDFEEEIRVVPVRRQLSVAIGGFAALLGAGLVFGAQTTGPDARIPYAIVIVGVQLLYVLAFTMAIRPPAAGIVAGISVATGAVAAWIAATSASPDLLPLLYVLGGGFLAALIGQAVRAQDRHRIRDGLGGTFLVPFGVVCLAVLILLTRIPVGTQAVLVCLAAAAVTLLAAHLTDAVWPRPRVAPQVPRGAAGIVLGTMLGTLTAAGLGSVLVLPVTPGKGAVLGLVVAGFAALIDLAVNYSEAGRGMAGAAPTLWVARHMQGPLGAFALAVPATYVMTVFFLS